MASGTSLIQAYGLSWRLDEINWHARPAELLGIYRSNPPGGRIRKLADFWDQSGIYILYSPTGPFYVGMSRVGLGNRLRSHSKDRDKRGRWESFSWFGFRRVTGQRDADGLSLLGRSTMSTPRISTSSAIREMEAVLINAMGLNKRSEMSKLGGEQWAQIRLEQRDRFLESINPSRGR
jgi:hypothetical protein